jgi:hypothetical protein
MAVVRLFEVVGVPTGSAGCYRKGTEQKTSVRDILISVMLYN